MDDLDAEERKCLAENIAWLERADPEDWHRVALDFNWGEPLYVLDWIARQPECDAATALTIFWQGEPAAWITEAGADAEEPNGFSYLNRKLCVAIANRIRAGGYRRSKIAFAPDTWTKNSFIELAAEGKRLANPNFRTHPDLIAKRRGRRVENDENFYRRYPEEFHHSAACELPGDTPRSLSLMERVRWIEQATLRALPAWLRQA